MQTLNFQLTSKNDQRESYSVKKYFKRKIMKYVHMKVTKILENWCKNVCEYGY